MKNIFYDLLHEEPSPALRATSPKGRGFGVGGTSRLSLREEVIERADKIESICRKLTLGRKNLHKIARTY